MPNEIPLSHPAYQRYYENKWMTNTEDIVVDCLWITEILGRTGLMDKLPQNIDFCDGYIADVRWAGCV